MSTKLIVLIMIAVLGITGISLCVAALLPRSWRWPWQWYRNNLRWYKRNKKHLLYVIGGSVPAPAAVIHGFNYWTGRIKMRKLRAIPANDTIAEYHANEITPVVFGNTLAKELPQGWREDEILPF